MSRKNASAICILVAAIWGGGFIATDAALANFDPFTHSRNPKNTHY